MKGTRKQTLGTVKGAIELVDLAVKVVKSGVAPSTYGKKIS